MPTTPETPTLDSKAVFPTGHRNGIKCLGWSIKNKRICTQPIGQPKYKKHLVLMEELNKLPLAQRAESSLLEEAVEILLCRFHIGNDFETELEKAQQKFKDAAAAEAERQKTTRQEAGRRRTRSSQVEIPDSEDETPIRTSRASTVRQSVDSEEAGRRHTRNSQIAVPNLEEGSPIRASRASTSRVPATRPSATGASLVNAPLARGAPTHTSAASGHGIRSSDSRASVTRSTPRHREVTLEYEPDEHKDEAPPESQRRRNGRTNSQQVKAAPTSPPPTPATRRVSVADSEMTLGRPSARRADVVAIASDYEDGSDTQSGEEDSDEDETRQPIGDGVYPMKLWDVYDRKWEALIKNGRVRGAPMGEQIPWPICTANPPSDVTMDNVRIFYINAGLGFASGSEKALMIAEECRRWHPKSTKKIFGRHIYDGIYGPALETIYWAAQSCLKELLAQPQVF
ncbi:hypothetical protein NM208_g10294 [Fusarium decemcellulare]|uniref:Uncharacterized protein n=1 Tax=Fusarium decemcellulare TaxID=57161 RepID=A0ACC1RYD8_9HYPO|nr:hypothetical protein NM208_g10294 [Fusarium decemcellulare]